MSREAHRRLSPGNRLYRLRPSRLQSTKVADAALVAGGYLDKAMARALVIKQCTVEFHIQNPMDKLARDRRTRMGL